MSETPKIAQLGQIANNLDTSRLKDLARQRHSQAKDELNRLMTEYQMERVRITEQARIDIERITDVAAAKLLNLEDHYRDLMKPAREMADYVGKLL